jgi:hypothetical protein
VLIYSKVFQCFECTKALCKLFILLDPLNKDYLIHRELTIENPLIFGILLRYGFDFSFRYFVILPMKNFIDNRNRRSVIGKRELYISRILDYVIFFD